MGWRGWIVVVVAALGVLAGCKKRGPAGMPEAGPCALIVTDDDIPSGSATAGALYVGEDRLGRKLLTADVVAVARGFMEGGIECVEVVDSHDGAVDLRPLRKIGVPVLTPSNRKDWAWPFIGPMEREYSMAALMGFHTNAGEVGFRAHTINGSIRGLVIDGDPVGEVGHLTVGLAAHGVPVVLVSGDMNATAEAERLVPGVEGVTVRWLDEAGEAAFLSSEEAGMALREAAARAAGAEHQVVGLEMPVEIRLSAWSEERMADRGPGVGAAFAEYLEEERALLEGHRLGPDVFASTLLDGGGRIDGYSLVWEEESLAAAFGSIAFAAWYMRGESGGWELVGEGFRAYRAGEYEEALEAYEAAIEADPYDVATRCRMGAVYQKLGQDEEAEELYGYAFERLEEVGDGPMKEWCVEGMAETAAAVGKVELAGEAGALLEKWVAGE